MESLGLLVGHLLGDYVFQNDWMAKWKTAKRGTTTEEEDKQILSVYGDLRYDAALSLDHWSHERPTIACLLHCVVYTFCVWACSFWWLPWWALVVCGVVHYPIDRWRLARRWMDVMGQTEFASGVFSPWSIIVVDNTFHLLTLLLLGALVS